MIKFKYRQYINYFLKPLTLFAAILSFFMILSLVSCGFINNQDADKSIHESVTNQNNNNSSTSNPETGEAGNSTERDKTDAADKKEEDQKQTTILIKNTVPSFAAATIKHEIKNIFSDANVTEGETAGESKNYSIIVDVAAPDISTENYIIFCAVTNFYSLCDDISVEEFKEYWDGNSKSIGNLSELVKVGGNIKNSDTDSSTTSSGYVNDLNNDTGTVLFLTEETEKIISVVFGDKKNNNIKIVSSGEIENSLENNPNSFAVIPFEELRKELKVLNIDGKSVFDKDFSYKSYPFSFSIGFGGYDSGKTANLKEAFEKIFFSNMDQDKMAVVNMTGVTALVRGVANRMDSKGILYPGEKIADVLKNADITHISNEISFKEDCNAGQGGTTFCSKPGYIELLKSVGADLIELTGNHLNDYGPQYLESTLKIYDELEWKYFGGGANLALSKEPALYEINGNKIAFLGFNQFGPSYDWATRNSAGSTPPDNPYYISEIKRLKEQGYNVIFTFQYEESYSYSPLDKQVEDFRMMRDAGADIVNGSQAHQPMGFEITRDSLICYGLGNLFFDQMQSLGTRQGIIAKHIFYSGKYISTQLIPTIIDDYCQPRLMNDAEKKEFLRSLYEASFK